MAHSDSHLLGLTPLGNPASLSVPEFIELNMTEVMKWHFWDWVIKGLPFVSVCSLSRSLGSLAPWEGSCNAVRMPCGEALVVSDQGLPTAMLLSLEVESLSRWVSVQRDLKSETPIKAVPSFLTRRNCKIISVCSFKLLNFEVICYMTLSNKYIMTGITNWILGKK